MDEETRLVPKQFAAALVTADPEALAPLTVDDLPKIMAALDVIAALIPDLRKPSPETAKKVRGARTVPREAVVSILAKAESSPSLPKVMNCERTHEVLESTAAFRLLGERMEMLQAQVKYTLEARWAEVVAPAMATYFVAGKLAKKPENADLVPHVATIRRHLGRTNGATGKRKKGEEPE
jgi:hypothetical protein